MCAMLLGLFIKGDNRWVVLANKTISVSLKGTLYRTIRIHFSIDFSSAQPATVIGDPDFSITVHDFGKMQNTSPTGLLGEESNIDVF